MRRNLEPNYGTRNMLHSGLNNCWLDLEKISLAPIFGNRLKKIEASFKAIVSRKSGTVGVGI